LAAIPKTLRPAYLHGLFLGLLRRFHPFVYGLLLKFRTRDGAREVEAVAPFDSRIRFQHIVIKGKDGFLFHRDHDALDQLTGGLVFRQRQIDVWIEALRAREAWCAARGAQMRFLIIPEKHVVYAEKLPRFIKIADRRAVTQLFAAADPALRSRMLYPIEALRAASADRRTFQKTDTHWTSYGAFVAYTALLDSLAAERPLEIARESELTWKERTVVGDLGVRFTRERGETVTVADPPSHYNLVFQNHNFGRGAVHVYESARRDLPRCVLFRDSFANALIPFLMRGFSRLVAVSSLSCHYDLLDQEKPDVVLFVAIERFMATFGVGSQIELPDDEARVPFATFSGTELRELERSES
jgi:hypothetical protein